MTEFLAGMTEVALHVVGWGILLYLFYVFANAALISLIHADRYYRRKQYEAYKAAASARDNSSNSKEAGE